MYFNEVTFQDKTVFVERFCEAILKFPVSEVARSRIEKKSISVCMYLELVHQDRFGSKAHAEDTSYFPRVCVFMSVTAQESRISSGQICILVN